MAGQGRTARNGRLKRLEELARGEVLHRKREKAHVREASALARFIHKPCNELAQHWHHARGISALRERVHKVIHRRRLPAVVA